MCHIWHMSLGRTPESDISADVTARLVRDRIGADSIYSLLHREGRRLFPDGDFADLFRGIGRASVPPQVVASVMVLQRLDGLSDREAVERFEFDLRWKYACGVPLDFGGFVHTVLVDMRERLRRSARPNRVFEKALEVARAAGLVGRRRVLDSTALYDAVATQDTVTLIRSAIRGLLKVASGELAQAVRAVLTRGDDYVSAGKPECDWDDGPAREALVDALARDAFAALSVLDGLALESLVRDAAQLLATATGQDIDQGNDGVFRIARRVAEGRLISIVDPDTRHGHKTSARGFDGYKGHIAMDPDSEVITATAVTAGNLADGKLLPELLAGFLPPESVPPVLEPVAGDPPSAVEASTAGDGKEVYGDASYGTAENLELLMRAKIECFCKTQPASARKGQFSKDAFTIDLESREVTCPAGKVAPLQLQSDGGARAEFGAHCKNCVLRDQCTDSRQGRTIRTHPKERTLQAARTAQKDPAWRKKYKAERPKVERKQAHMMRRRHGGRRARVRGCVRVGQDFALLAAATNLHRLAVKGVRFDGEAWRQ